ncbi:MAG: sugar ABC transporter permease [Bifidobacterium sp.]|uniref:carbohydrate ABC transporter permease n=1 Tax=Bifidobacterium sp. TaxID=41200 RepID=UPI0039E9B252
MTTTNDLALEMSEIKQTHVDEDRARHPVTENPKNESVRRQSRAAWMFLVIPLLFFAVFVIIPLLLAVGTSFTDYSIVSAPHWIGLANFRAVLSDSFFWVAMRNTVYYTAVYVPLGLVVSFGTALLLNRRTWSAKVFRTLFYIPVVSSSVATATIWVWVLNKDKGMLNMVLGWFHINGPNWLNDSQWAMFAIILMSIWAGFGVNMIIFLGGLQSVPVDLREAAKLDGANWWQIVWNVVIPSIRPTMFLVTMQLIIGSFQVFDQAYLLTGGGPGNATITIVYYIYNSGFGSLKMGYASALSFVLFAIILVFSLINMHFTDKEES